MIHLALHEPKIAPNTGNIIRLIANNGADLHLIEPLGFDLDEKKVRRAGLDYADLEHVHRHANYLAFLAAVEGRRIIACTTKGAIRHDEVRYTENDVLLFGSETAGLPSEVLDSFPDTQKARIPMCPTSRSMNLSNAAAIVSYEAWRQLGFVGGR